jgi:hypothetical protein
MTRALSVSEVADLTGLSEKELEERVVQRSLRVLRADGEWMISLDSLARAGLAASGGEDGDPGLSGEDGVLARLERLAIALGEQRRQTSEARSREAVERSARAAAEAELREEREYRRQMEVEREAALGIARAAEAARRMAESGRGDTRVHRTSAPTENQPAPAPRPPRWHASLPRPSLKRPSLPRPSLKRPSLPRPSLGRPGVVAAVVGRAARSLRAMARPGVREVPLLGPIRVVPAIAAAGAACLILFGLSAVGMPAGGLVVLGGALAALVYLVGTGPRDRSR